MYPPDHRKDVPVRRRIETGCRLIEYQDLRIHGDDTGYSDASLHTARQLERRHIFYLVIIESHKFYCVPDPLFSFFLIHTEVLRTESDIEPHGLLKELVLRILENEAHLAPYIGHLYLAVGYALSVNVYLTRRRLYESVQVLEQRRLARSRVADNSKDLAVRDIKRDIAYGDGLVRHPRAVYVSEILYGYRHFLYLYCCYVFSYLICRGQ